MNYANFSRHLREKYSTRVHIAEQIIDQMKYNDQWSAPSACIDKLHRTNMIKAQQEISFSLISYLNKFECEKSNSNENNQALEPYFQECVLAAGRIKNNRRAERDRQICYENFILAEKLERIKNPSGRISSEKDYGNKLVKKRFSETVIISSQSSSTIKSKISASDDEDDQATAADVDVGMDYYDSRSLRKRRNKSRKNPNSNCGRSMSLKNENQKFFETENEHVYQHLNNIDMLMNRDTKPLPKPQNSRHFSICILPHSDSDVLKPKNNHFQFLSNDPPCAFKQEVLYD
ncbi:unnamed protein product [Rotaria magnacalcarata]|uniref:Uncharacterized protein n=2 Tax=Rotaria magnacalcarata TaxID=392030 RepID=A0A814S924_9BILA|nr:unnamed protein product [Rotaria magnacalcarata]CAF1391536.1 unnamed protein product [Rotaria magnacalcarata]CAF2029656.1 unnamed protein product [Rotaria magnacalcarata]CAF4195528.1 unnamed protein product [Rotaria magnacalcarata]